MENSYLEDLRAKLDEENYHDLMAIKNERLHKYIDDAIELC